MTSKFQQQQQRQPTVYAVAPVGADFHRAGTTETALKLSPTDDDTLGRSAGGLVATLMNPPPGSCATMPHAASMRPMAPAMPMPPGVQVSGPETLQARIGASTAPSDLVRSVAGQQNHGLLAAAANAKPIIAAPQYAAPKAPVQPAEQTTKGTALTPAELALRMAQFDSEYAKDRRDIPFTLHVFRKPDELATQGTYAFKLTMSDSDKDKHVIVDSIRMGITNNSLVKIGVHFPALEDSHLVSYDNGTQSKPIHMLCPALSSISAPVEAFRRKVPLNLRYATRYGDIRSPEDVDRLIIPDEVFADRYRTPLDSAMGRVALTTDKEKELQYTTLPGLDGKEYIVTEGRKGLDQIAAFIKDELFEKTANHGKNVIDPAHFPVEFVPIGIGATWGNLPALVDDKLARNHPIDVTINGEMSVLLVGKPVGAK